MWTEEDDQVTVQGCKENEKKNENGNGPSKKLMDKSINGKELVGYITGKRQNKGIDIREILG